MQTASRHECFSTGTQQLELIPVVKAVRVPGLGLRHVVTLAERRPTSVLGILDAEVVPVRDAAPAVGQCAGGGGASLSTVTSTCSRALETARSGPRGLRLRGRLEVVGPRSRMSSLRATSLTVAALIQARRRRGMWPTCARGRPGRAVARVGSRDPVGDIYCDRLW